MNRILVTGAAGFIGSHLIAGLVAVGRSIRALDSMTPQIHGLFPAGPAWQDSPQVEFVRTSICDAIDWDAMLDGVSAVVHLAAETGTGQSMYEIARYTQVNTMGTAILMEQLAKRRGGPIDRIVLASSRSIYGEGAYRCPSCELDPVYPEPRSAAALAAANWEQECPRCAAPLNFTPTTEDAPVRPASVYAATKAAQEDLVRIVAAASDMAATILRFQNVYGEGQSLNNPYTGILSIFSTRIRRGIDLPIFEDGEETRDFVHVSDVVAAILLALDAPVPCATTLNVGSGLATSVATVATELARAFGEEPALRVTGEYRVGDIRHNVADLTRIEQALGFVPQVSLIDGLARFGAWVSSQPLPEDQLDKANAQLRARRLMS